MKQAASSLFGRARLSLHCYLFFEAVLPEKPYFSHSLKIWNLVIPTMFYWSNLIESVYCMEFQDGKLLGKFLVSFQSKISKMIGAAFQ